MLAMSMYMYALMLPVCIVTKLVSWHSYNNIKPMESLPSYVVICDCLCKTLHVSVLVLTYFSKFKIS